MTAAPQEVTVLAVRRYFRFGGILGAPVIGFVEKVSGSVCPHCGEEAAVFKRGDGERPAREPGIPFLGSIL